MHTTDLPAALPMTPAPVPARARARGRVLAELVRAGERSVQVRVRGSCMHPALRDGEIVTLRPALAYRPGDIVGVARADGTLTLHRLLGYRPSRRGLAVWTQADRADAPDPAALLAATVGRVDRPVPLWRRLRAGAAYARALAAWLDPRGHR